MGDAMGMAQQLRDAPDLLPWVVFVAVAMVLYKERATVREYFTTKIEANREAKTQSAILVEVLRNNTAALDNNTAALESVKADRGDTRRLLEHHEDMSAEREARMLAIVQRVEARVNENSGKLGLIEDRTEKR